MCDIVAILKSELPDQMIERRGLAPLLHSRGEGSEEVWFAEKNRRSFLPVWHDGQLTIYPWGSKYRTDKVPLGGKCRQTELEAGSWEWLRPEPISIVATFGCCNGFWFDVPEGIRGVLIRDARNRPRVYMLVTTSTHYFRTMTRSPLEPVFIGPQI